MAVSLSLSASLEFASADDLASTRQFDHYTVHYSVFPSTTITPEIAAIYGIKRGPGIALINITVIDDDLRGEAFGQAATVTGTASNLMQQQRELAFKQITEPNAVYYLASLRHTNEEVMHFAISVTPQDKKTPFTFKFTKTLYVHP